jgi:hypothetical protein
MTVSNRSPAPLLGLGVLQRTGPDWSTFASKVSTTAVGTGVVLMNARR